MALSRWSYSYWYIYENGSDDNDPSLCISGVANVLYSELKENFDSILNKIIQDEFQDDTDQLIVIPSKRKSFTREIAKKELSLYLRYWVESIDLIKDESISNEEKYERNSKKLNQLRQFGYNRAYFDRGILIEPGRGLKNHKDVVYYIKDKKSYRKYSCEFDIICFTVTKVKNNKYDSLISGFYYDKKCRKIDLSTTRLEKLFTEYPVLPNQTYEVLIKDIKSFEGTIYNHLIKNRTEENIDYFLKEMSKYQLLINEELNKPK